MKPQECKTERKTMFLSKIYASREEEPAIFRLKGWLITLFILCTLLLAFTSCEEPIEDVAARDFIIPQGEHYATPRLFERFETGSLAFRATFDESAVYKVDQEGIETSKNILMGFTDCTSAHNANSARFAWQWFNNRLEIYAFCYTDSIPVEEYIGVVNLNEENEYEIAVTESQYVFYMNGKEMTSIERVSVCNAGANYVFFPYFGGSVPAPHNVRVHIEMLE